MLRQGSAQGETPDSTNQVGKNQASGDVREVYNTDGLGNESFTSWFAGACI